MQPSSEVSCEELVWARKRNSQMHPYRPLGCHHLLEPVTRTGQENQLAMTWRSCKWLKKPILHPTASLGTWVRETQVRDPSPYTTYRWPTWEALGNPQLASMGNSRKCQDEGAKRQSVASSPNRASPGDMDMRESACGTHEISGMIATEVKKLLCEAVKEIRSEGWHSGALL